MLLRFYFHSLGYFRFFVAALLKKIDIFEIFHIKFIIVHSVFVKHNASFDDMKKAS